MMDGEVYENNDYNDISQRSSKRRRLAEDPGNAELAWSAAQHAPTFFAIAAPSRIDEHPGPEQFMQCDWTSTPSTSQAALHPAYRDGPYFQSQSLPEAYASLWPPAASPSTYVALPTTYADFLPAQQQSQILQEGAQYLGGTGLPYDSSVPNGYDNNDHSILSGVNLGPQAPECVRFAEDLTPYQSGIQTLSSLDSLATQIIQTVARLSHAEYQEASQGISTEARQYLNIISLFEQERALIAPGSALVNTNLFQTFSLTQQDVLRKINTASLVISVLGRSNIPFFELDQAFLEIFVPLGHRLLKWQGAIYLELKTQTFILALMNNSSPPETLLDQLFPPDLESHIVQRHREALSLSPSEQDFIGRCRARRQYLLAESYSLNAANELPAKYPWVDFIREFSACISKNVEHILSPSHRQTAMQSVVGRRRAGSGLDLADDHSNSESGHNVGHSLSKKTATNGQTIRQAWITAEEEALMAGLERVGGPHWSQILALYGRGGSISEVLKDRNQVQLKDKARNIKLWYLKMGQEVPVALRGVTGELRKRGGARARAALEAEEHKGRRRSDETEYELEPLRKRGARAALGAGGHQHRRVSDEAEHELDSLRRRGARAALEVGGHEHRRVSDEAEHELDSMLGIRHDTVDPDSYYRLRK